MNFTRRLVSGIWILAAGLVLSSCVFGSSTPTIAASIANNGSRQLIFIVDCSTDALGRPTATGFIFPNRGLLRIDVQFYIGEPLVRNLVTTAYGWYNASDSMSQPGIDSSADQPTFSVIGSSDYAAPASSSKINHCAASAVMESDSAPFN
jgi:hypothetical protein